MRTKNPAIPPGVLKIFVRLSIDILAMRDVNQLNGFRIKKLKYHSPIPGDTKRKKSNKWSG